MEYQAGNIFLRPNRMVAGQTHEEHMHEFDHVTFFVQGQFRARRWRQALDKNLQPVIADGEKVWVLQDDRIFSAGQWCLIEKNVRHLFECLTEGMFCCCYAHRDPQSHEVVQDFNGWMKAYE